MFALNIIPTKCAELSKINEKCQGKKLREKEKYNLLFLVNTKNIPSTVFKIIRTREITDIFNTFDEIFLVFWPVLTSNK